MVQMTCIPLSLNQFTWLNVSVIGLCLSLGAIGGMLLERKIGKE